LTTSVAALSPFRFQLIGIVFVVDGGAIVTGFSGVGGTDAGRERRQCDERAEQRDGRTCPAVQSVHLTPPMGGRVQRGTGRCADQSSRIRKLRGLYCERELASSIERRRPD
jgi:hypothetical protein